MMTRANLAAFYQDQAAAYTERALIAREHYEVYRRSWLWRGTGLVDEWLKAWSDRMTMAECYALTARTLMGVEE